jgi:hypothetical protein
MSYGNNSKQFDDNNRGAMFARQKRSAGSPDMGGDFTLAGDVLDYVRRCIERNEPVKLEISAWRKMSRGNTPFTSIAIDIPWQVKKGGQPQSQQRDQYGQQGGGYQQRDQGYGQQQQSFDTGSRSGGYVDRGSTAASNNNYGSASGGGDGGWRR